MARGPIHDSAQNSCLLALAPEIIITTAMARHSGFDQVKAKMASSAGHLTCDTRCGKNSLTGISVIGLYKGLWIFHFHPMFNLSL
jgi:hypothetical protein